MFKESSAIDSERTAASVRSLYAKYSGDENWFTGTPDSVDRRIAQAKKISNISKAASVRLSGRNAASQYIALAHEMDADVRVLEGLRHDLLTAAMDRESAMVDWHSFDPIVHKRTEGAPRHPLDALHHQVGRDMVHVDDLLEDNGVKPPGYFSRGPGKHQASRADARYFVAEQECSDLRELLIRAQRHAEDISSTLPVHESRTFVSSFLEAVRGEYRPPRQSRTAAKAPVQDFSDYMMYGD